MRKYLASLPAIIIMIAIFWFSSQPAVDSSQQSSGITEKLIRGVNSLLGLDMSDEELELKVIKYETPVRKSAHITEYFVLTLAFCLALYNWNIKGKKLLLFSFLLTVCYAITDEVHQYFIPGRACLFTDVLIDSIGVLIGIVVLSLLMKSLRINGKK